MFQSETLTEGQNRMNNNLTRKRLLHRAKNKSLKISLVIVAAFIIWWTPYYTMMIIFMFLDPDVHVRIVCFSSFQHEHSNSIIFFSPQLSQDLKSAIFFFGMSNSLINPLIYGAFHLWPRRKTPKPWR